MSDNNGNGNGFLKNLSVSVTALLIVSLLSWSWYSVNSLQQSVATLDVKVAYLENTAKEIVPRSENEKRWEALQRTVEQISQFIYQSKMVR